MELALAGRVSGCKLASFLVCTVSRNDFLGQASNFDRAENETGRQILPLFRHASRCCRAAIVFMLFIGIVDSERAGRVIKRITLFASFAPYMSLPEKPPIVGVQYWTVLVSRRVKLAVPITDNWLPIVF